MEDELSLDVDLFGFDFLLCLLAVSSENDEEWDELLVLREACLPRLGLWSTSSSDAPLPLYASWYMDVMCQLTPLEACQCTIMFVPVFYVMMLFFPHSLHAKSLCFFLRTHQSIAIISLPAVQCAKIKAITPRLREIQL